MAAFTTERVTQVQHWSDRLFSFRTTRGSALRFENGQFVMIGLELGGRKLVRAYSIASANYEEELEFYSIKVPDGPLTSRLQHVNVGASILVSSKPTGTLVHRDIRPGTRLFMLATGTGIAPFISLCKDVEIYERFEKVIVVRGGRAPEDLAYGDDRLQRLREDAYLGREVASQLLDYRSVTRTPFPHRGRITDLLCSGRVCGDLGVAPLDPATDRLMICGSMRMLADARRLLDDRGFRSSPGIGQPGDYVFERAFVESFAGAPGTSGGPAAEESPWATAEAARV